MADNPTGSDAEAMAALLTPKVEESQDQPEAEPQEETTDVVVETEEEEVPEEVTPEVEGEDVASEESEEDQPEEVTEEDSEEERLAGLRQEDYTRKTKELAEQRKGVEALAEAFQERLEQAELVAQLEKEDLQSVENQELLEFDPKAYYEKKERIEAKEAQLAEMREERDLYAQQQKAERLASEQELVLPAIPQWVDQDTMMKEIPMMQKMWTDMGFTAEELDMYADHRLVVISRKAALYDQIMSAKPEEKKVTEKPKSAQPGTTTTKEEKATQRSQAARNRLKETGKDQDALRVLLET